MHEGDAQGLLGSAKHPVYGKITGGVTFDFLQETFAEVGVTP